MHIIWLVAWTRSCALFKCSTRRQGHWQCFHLRSHDTFQWFKGVSHLMMKSHKISSQKLTKKLLCLPSRPAVISAILDCPFNKKKNSFFLPRMLLNLHLTWTDHCDPARRDRRRVNAKTLFPILTDSPLNWSYWSWKPRHVKLQSPLVAFNHFS